MGILPHAQHRRIGEGHLGAGTRPGVHLVSFDNFTFLLCLFFLRSVRLGDIVFHCAKGSRFQRFFFRAPCRAESGEQTGHRQQTQPSHGTLAHFAVACLLLG